MREHRQRRPRGHATAKETHPKSITPSKGLTIEPPPKETGPQPLYRIGYVMDHESVYYCSHCDSAVCDECSKVCATCGEIVCGECASHCNLCECSLCPECARTKCGECESTCCASCITDGLCPDCKEERETEDEEQEIEETDETPNTNEPQPTPMG